MRNLLVGAMTLALVAVCSTALAEGSLNPTQELISNYRQRGYTDEQIYHYLETSKAAHFKFEAAKKAGYSDDEIKTYLGLTRIERPELTAKECEARFFANKFTSLDESTICKGRSPIVAAEIKRRLAIAQQTYDQRQQQNAATEELARQQRLQTLLQFDMLDQMRAAQWDRQREADEARSRASEERLRAILTPPAAPTVIYVPQAPAYQQPAPYSPPVQTICQRFSEQVICNTQ